MLAMLVLGIETSDRPGSAALCRDGDCLAEVPLELDGLRHAQALPPVVATLLADHHVTPGSLDIIAVSRGPGSFTGLRVGIAFAKTLAWAVGCKLVAVDTFEAIATEASIDGNTLWVASDAHREQLYVRHFNRQTDGRWQPDGDHSIVPCREWCEARTTDEVSSDQDSSSSSDLTSSRFGISNANGPLAFLFVPISLAS